MSRFSNKTKKALENALTKRLRELNFWEFDEANDLLIIAEHHELKELINEINEKFYKDED